MMSNDAPYFEPTQCGKMTTRPPGRSRCSPDVLPMLWRCSGEDEVDAKAAGEEHGKDETMEPPEEEVSWREEHWGRIVKQYIRVLKMHRWIWISNELRRVRNGRNMSQEKKDWLMVRNWPYGP